MKKAVLLAPTPPPAGGIAQWTVRYLASPLKNGWQLELVDEKLIGGREAFGAGTKRSLLTEAKRCLRIWSGLHRALKDDAARLAHSCIPAEPGAMLRDYASARQTVCNPFPLYRSEYGVRRSAQAPCKAALPLRRLDYRAQQPVGAIRENAHEKAG